MAWYDDTRKKSQVREYASRGEFEKDAANAAEHGWTVASATEISQRGGCLRFLTLGLFMILFKPKPHILVTYAHP